MILKQSGKFLSILVLGSASISYAGQSGVNGSAGRPVELKCGTPQAMANYYGNNPGALKKAQAANRSIEGAKISQQVYSTSQSGETASSSASATYTIPVVFHVYGTDFNGLSVDNALIEDALLRTNQDFQGLAPDYDEIIAEFASIKQTLSVEFKLAQLDPNGNATTGVVYHPEACGAGNYSDSNVANDNWDNYKYMNVYIQNDLYCNGATNSSGVAWYPDTAMSDQGIARVTYNGAYLGNNTNENFRSVLTHEFGHWLNLIHTFEGGCSKKPKQSCEVHGDKICDTPRVDNSSLQGVNCRGEMTNWQNFMHYSDQYANFTQDQVTRMLAALSNPARNTLWTAANLAATGLGDGTPTNQAPVANANGPYAALTEQTISFSSSGSNDADGSIDAYFWNFGDGNTSTAANPTHAYSTAGSYDVTLTVTDNQGATGSESTTATITDDNGGGSNVPDACANQSPVTGGTLRDGDVKCLGSSNNMSFRIRNVNQANSLAITTGNGTGDLNLSYHNNATGTVVSNNIGNDECIYITSSQSGSWGNLTVTGSATGASIAIDFNTSGCR